MVGHHPDPEAVGEAGLQDGEELSLGLCASAHGEGPAYRRPGAFAPTSRAFRGWRRTRSRTRRIPPHAVPVGAPGSTPGNVPQPRWGRPPGRPGRRCGAQASGPAAARACAAGPRARRCDRAARCPRFDGHGRARSPLALRCQRGRPPGKKPDFPGNTPDHRCSAATTLPPPRTAPPRRPAHPPLAPRGRLCPGRGAPGALRCRARPPAGRGGADAGGARPAGLRQPQPPDGQRGDGRVRHGLHAGHLPPAPDRAAVVRPDAVAAGDRLRLPVRAGAAPVRPRLRDARAGRRQGARQPHQDGPVRERGSGVPRACAAAGGGVRTGCTGTRASG